MIFFFWVVIKLIKNENLEHLASMSHSIKRCGRFYKNKFLYLDD